MQTFNHTYHYLATNALRYQATERHIPDLTGPRTWPTGSIVGTEPSVVSLGGHIDRPVRTLHGLVESQTSKQYPGGSATRAQLSLADEFLLAHPVLKRVLGA